MKTKRFQSYLEKRLNKKEIAGIEQQANLEVKIFKAIQNGITKAISEYMEANDIGFNELVRRLDAVKLMLPKYNAGKLI